MTMSTESTPTVAEVADVCDKAAQVLVMNGFCKKSLYDPRQAAAGADLAKCRVDVIGALNIAAHGTPRYACSKVVYAAERALLARINMPSIVTWTDAKGRTKDDAVTLLRDAAASLRAGEAA